MTAKGARVSHPLTMGNPASFWQGPEFTLRIARLSLRSRANETKALPGRRRQVRDSWTPCSACLLGAFPDDTPVRVTLSPSRFFLSLSLSLSLSPVRFLSLFLFLALNYQCQPQAERQTTIMYRKVFKNRTGPRTSEPVIKVCDLLRVAPVRTMSTSRI